jgi:hypothetical protein
MDKVRTIWTFIQLNNILLFGFRIEFDRGKSRIKIQGIKRN